jgi:Protein of unknown function (DUF3237)
MAGASGPQSPAAEHPVNCPSCGFVNTEAARFCGGCGKSVSDLPGRLPASSSAGVTAISPRLQAKKAPTQQGVSMRAQDGSELRWGEADTPVPAAVIPPGAPAAVAVAVSPVRPGHAVTVDYQVNGGPVRQAVGLPEPRVYGTTGRVFRALLPGLSTGMVEFLPVLRFAGQPISPRLGQSAECPRYQVGHDAAPVETTAVSATPVATSADQARWDWDTKFLWACSAAIRQQVIGELPDGLRINFEVTEGRFVGPHFEGIVLPGGVNWMRIREDGVAMVNVTECLQTRTGTRIDSLYGGILDLGPAGYARALRGEFDPLPPFVLAPTYATADKELAWLNGAQCIGVGRVDMKTLRAEYDVYVVSVGSQLHTWRWMH